MGKELSLQKCFSESFLIISENKDKTIPVFLAVIFLSMLTVLGSSFRLFFIVLTILVNYYALSVVVSLVFERKLPFKAFNVIKYALLMFVLGILLLVGLLFFAVPGILFAFFTTYALVISALNDFKVSDSITKSFKIVKKNFTITLKLCAVYLLLLLPNLVSMVNTFYYLFRKEYLLTFIDMVPSMGLVLGIWSVGVNLFMLFAIAIVYKKVA